MDPGPICPHRIQYRPSSTIDLLYADVLKELMQCIIQMLFRWSLVIDTSLYESQRLPAI